ncbi:MAG: lectin like domain-containing protein [Oscillospiraceae bacterium]|nr:lectin like domain-containing protein [Oscillospiraceae bacterium]
MKKRITSILLTVALIAPMFSAGNKAVALSTSNYTAEPYTFVQSAAASTTAILASPSLFTSDFGYLAGSVHKMPGASDNASWVYAAIAALNAAAQNAGNDITEFNETDLAYATSNKGTNSGGNSGGFNRDPLGAGNRSMLTAYLMRGLNGGPVAGWSESIKTSNDKALSKEKPTQPVSGVVYIPNLKTTAAEPEKEIYRNRIKNAVLECGAVAASLYFDESRFWQDEIDSTNYLYDNFTRKVDGNSAYSALNRAADHSVAIIGWDDSKEFKYPVTKIIGNVEETIQVTVKGGFLVYDSINLDGYSYWVSYDTVLNNAYFIEGFHNKSAFPLVSPILDEDDNPIADNKNPLAHTYEYDLYGMTGVRTIAGSSTAEAYYANVFKVEQEASALHAVSLFLTAEDSFYEIYLINDYKEPENLKNPQLKGTLIASGDRALPGYYTIPTKNAVHPTTPIIKGERFAIVAVVTSTSGDKPAIPIQSTSLAAPKSGQGFYSSDGNTWTDAFNQGQAAICLKAHAEKSVNVDLDYIEIQDKDGEKVTASNTLKVAPGSKGHALGPALIPANANNVIKDETVWMAEMQYYKRAPDGWIITDENYEATLETADELIWSDKWGMFIPPKDHLHEYPETPPYGTNFSQSDRGRPEGDTKAAIAVKNHIPQPLSIVGSKSGSATLSVSNHAYYYDLPLDENDDPPDNLVFELTATVKTGVRKNGEFKTSSGKVITNSPAPGETTSFYVEIIPTKVHKIELNRTTHTMKAGATVTLTAKQLDDKDVSVGTSALTIKWSVLDAKGDLYTIPYDPRDPYNEFGPIAMIDQKGKVTAIRDGTCVIKAEVTGGVTAECKITITAQAATGISLNKKKMTMSAGTTLTLTATVKPASASNKKVHWTTEPDDLSGPISVNSAGIITAKTDLTGLPKTAKVIATTKDGGKIAECIVTVTEGPSSTIKRGKSVTYSILGAGTKDTVEWYFDLGGGATDTSVKTPGGQTIVAGPDKTSGTKYKVTSQNVGSAVLVGKVTVPLYDTAGNETGVRVPIREQTWKLESVVPISKMVMKKDDTIVKKLVLSVSDTTDAADSVILDVGIVKPADATELNYEWIPKKNKAGEEMVLVNPQNSIGSKIEVTANKPGSAKITGINYNGNKKINLSIKVLFFPTADQIITKKPEISLDMGKKGNAKAKVTGKNVNKELSYKIKDSDPSIKKLDDGIIKLEEKKGKTTGKFTALAPGTTTIVITGAGGAYKEVTVEVKEKTGRR